MTSKPASLSPENSREIILLSGKRAVIRESDGDKTIILSPESSPPGSTVQGSLESVSALFQLKVKSCQKAGDLFIISGRTQNATKEMRAVLKGAVLKGAVLKGAVLTDAMLKDAVLKDD